jgi:hypothetical protein
MLGLFECSETLLEAQNLVYSGSIQVVKRLFLSQARGNVCFQCRKNVETTSVHIQKKLTSTVLSLLEFSHVTHHICFS